MDLAELRESFSHFDADGNGRIDRREFAHLMRALDADLTTEELAIGFSEIDTDHSGMIEFDEFVRWWSDR